MYSSTGMSPQMWALIGIICVLILVVFPILIMKAMGGRKKWQNKIMQPIINDYRRLANILQSSPPEVPDYQGYKSWPTLNVIKNKANIKISPTTVYSFEWEKEYLYRDPYTDISSTDRMYGSAGMQAAQAMFGNRRHHYNRQNSGQQLTEVKLKMPESFKGSRILITPETILGKVFSMGEIKINYPDMDKNFNIRGLNAAFVTEFLTPEVCDALLKFRKSYGKFQLNEDYLLWIKTGYSIDKIQNVVEGMVILSDVIFCKYPQ